MNKDKSIINNKETKVDKSIHLILLIYILISIVIPYNQKLYYIKGCFTIYRVLKNLIIL